MSPLRCHSALDIRWPASQRFSGRTGPCRHVAYISRQRTPFGASLDVAAGSGDHPPEPGCARAEAGTLTVAYRAHPAPGRRRA